MPAVGRLALLVGALGCALAVGACGGRSPVRRADCLPSPLHIAPARVKAGGTVAVSSPPFTCRGSYPAGHRYTLVLGQVGRAAPLQSGRIPGQPRRSVQGRCPYPTTRFARPVLHRCDRKHVLRGHQKRGGQLRGIRRARRTSCRRAKASALSEVDLSGSDDNSLHSVGRSSIGRADGIMRWMPTDSLTLTALKMNLPMARRDIAEWARVLDLRVEQLAERRGLLAVRLKVTVTGPDEQIESFRYHLAGGGLVSQAGNPIDALFNGLIEESVKAFGRWRRSRARRKQR